MGGDTTYTPHCNGRVVLGMNMGNTWEPSSPKPSSRRVLTQGPCLLLPMAPHNWHLDSTYTRLADIQEQTQPLALKPDY